MKLSTLFLVGGLTLATVTARPSSRLAAEWFVPSESSGKKFSLIDQATGQVRLGSVSSDGSTSFSQPLTTGVRNVSDVAGGRFGTDELLAVTSPEANRVAVLSPNATVPVARSLQGFSGLGVSGLAEIRSGTSLELALASIFNGGATGTRMEAVGSPGSSPGLLALTDNALAIRSMEPFSDLAGTTTVAIYRAASGTNTAVGFIQRSTTSMTAVSKVLFSGDLQLVCDVTTAASERILVGYRSGMTLAHLLKVSLPLTTASSLSNTTITLPYPVSAVLPVLAGGAGNLTDGIILIAADGSRAEGFRVNAAATGLVTTGLVFTPPAGSLVTGLLPLPGIGLVKLSGATASGPSSAFETMIWNGSAWVTAASGNLPVGALNGHNFATLLYYTENPLTNEGARLLGVQDAPDWTRRSSLPDPVPVSVLRESFVSATTGLTGAVAQSLNPPTGTNYVITNQVENGLSIAALTGRVDALFTPSLTITPESGSYAESFQISALFDEARFELLSRQEPSGSWAVVNRPLAVGYSIDLQFRLRSLATGASGEIVRRSYTLSTAALATQDSDADGVPDYVELGRGLDPFGGADADADGVSDLAELLATTDPANPLSFPADSDGDGASNWAEAQAGTNPADPNDYPIPSVDIGTGSGMEIVAVARNTGVLEMATGEEIDARSLDGSLLARAPVATLASALPDGGSRGAALRSDHSIPQDQLIALSAPQYFDLTSGLRNGREIIRLIQATPPPVFTPVFSPAGNNLAADTAGWVTAAQTAWASYHHVLARTLADPEDSAVSVLVEQLIHDALVQVRPVTDPAPALDAFTLFSSRSPDLARVPLSAADLALLAAAGFDLPTALARAQVARPSLVALADGVYNRHVSVSASTAGMELPVDALRTLLRSGVAPTGYAGAVSAANLATARNAYASVVAGLAGIFRPVASWTVEIPATSAGRAVYRKLPGLTEVILLANSEERFPLEQGLGLAPGTRFMVTGFTDTAPIGGRATIQVTAVAVVFLPGSSDRDADGNLLDDEWELFFFGATGRNPYAAPASGSGTLLQYFLDGLDPRGSDGLAIPADLRPVLVSFVPAAGGGHLLDFSFPAAYQDRFDFVVERSTTLTAGSFVTHAAPITPQGGDLMRATISATAGARAFFRVRVQLK